MKHLLQQLAELFKTYNEIHEHYEKVEKTLTSEARAKLWRTTYWNDIVGKPFAVMLLDKLNYKLDEISGPFGIGCKLIIKTKRGKRITIEPSLSMNTFYIIDYSVNTNEYASGTIGAMSGMNNPAIDIKTIKSIKQLRKLVFTVHLIK